jgi:hypothetical protein
MRRFTGTEKAALALAAVLAIGGLFMIFHPLDMVVPHGGYWRSGNSLPDHVSEKGARCVGGGVILMGGGIAALIFFGPRNS